MFIFILRIYIKIIGGTKTFFIFYIFYTLRSEKLTFLVEASPEPKMNFSKQSTEKFYIYP